MVRQRFAKPLYAGSNPVLASSRTRARRAVLLSAHPGRSSVPVGSAIRHVSITRESRRCALMQRRGQLAARWLSFLTAAISHSSARAPRSARRPTSGRLHLAPRARASHPRLRVAPCRLSPPTPTSSPSMSLMAPWRNGRRRGLKIPSRKACRFESGRGYSSSRAAAPRARRSSRIAAGVTRATRAHVRPPPRARRPQPLTASRAHARARWPRR